MVIIVMSSWRGPSRNSIIIEDFLLRKKCCIKEEYKFVKKKEKEPISFQKTL